MKTMKVSQLISVATTNPASPAAAKAMSPAAAKTISAICDN